MEVFMRKRIVPLICFFILIGLATSMAQNDRYISPEQTQKRLEAKLNKVQLGIKQWEESGRTVYPTFKFVQEAVPLIKQGKMKEAEALLDNALNMLGLDTSEAISPSVASTTYIGSPLGTWKNGKGGFEVPEYLIENGMNLLHLQAPWDQIEAQPGRINIYTDELKTLALLTSRYPEFEEIVVVIKMIDTNIRTVPHDLAISPFDDLKLMARFYVVIDALAKDPLSKKIDILLLGNEVDIYLGSHSRRSIHL